jgi:hypothetical protein
MEYLKLEVSKQRTLVSERTSAMQMPRSGRGHSRRDCALGLGTFRLGGSDSSRDTCKVVGRQRARSLGQRVSGIRGGMPGQSWARLTLKTSL